MPPQAFTSCSADWKTQAEGSGELPGTPSPSCFLSRPTVLQPDTPPHFRFASCCPLHCLKCPYYPAASTQPPHHFRRWSPLPCQWTTSPEDTGLAPLGMGTAGGRVLEGWGSPWDLEPCPIPCEWLTGHLNNKGMLCGTNPRVPVCLGMDSQSRTCVFGRGSRRRQPTPVPGAKPSEPHTPVSPHQC